MKKLPTVSIIIPTWNGKEDTLECLKSISNLNYPKTQYETVVVDNFSNDGSPKAIRKRFPFVRIIKNKEDKGYGGAVNIGVLKTKNEFILALNNDVVLDKDFLKNIVKASIENRKVGAFGPLVMFYDDPKVIQKAYATIDEKSLILKNIGRGEINKGQYKKNIFVEAPAFTGILIKREVFNKVGLFDERFFHSYEDVDFLLRVKDAAYKMVFVPHAKLWHKGGKSYGQTSPQLTYYFTRNDLLIRSKYDLLTLKDKIKAFKFMLSSKLMSFLPIKNRVQYKAISLAIYDFYMGKFGKVEI